MTADNLFSRYEKTREVCGRSVGTPEQLGHALGLVFSADTNSPGLQWWDGYRNGEKAVHIILTWPLWLIGNLTRGKVIVGDTLYEAPCKIAFPAVQNIEIVEPITFAGILGTKLKP